MSNGTLQIQLLGQEWQTRTAVVRPNTTLTGNIILQPERDIRARRVVVQLRWRTEGRGTAASQNVAEKIVHNGDIAGYMAKAWPFALAVPVSPWSYTGHLIAVVWEVVVTVNIPLRRDWVVTEPIRVEPIR